MTFRRILLEPQGVEGGGGSATTTTPEKPAENQGGGNNSGPDLAEAIKGLLARNGGDASSAMRVLLNENHDYRDQLRDLKGKVPADGAVVLMGDDAKHWGDYRKFGAPSEIRKAIEERDAHKVEAGTLRKAEVVRTVAELEKFKPSVLATLAKDLTLEVVEAKGKDGKPVKQAVVKGDGDATTPLSEWAEKHWADFLPSLKAEANQPSRPLGTPIINRSNSAPAPPTPEGQAQRRSVL